MVSRGRNGGNHRGHFNTRTGNCRGGAMAVEVFQRKGKSCRSEGSEGGAMRLAPVTSLPIGKAAEDKRTAALQDATASHGAQAVPPGPGVRLSSCPLPLFRQPHFSR